MTRKQQRNVESGNGGKPWALTTGALLAAMLLVGSVGQVQAAPVVWDGGGNGVNWLDALNWDTDDAPDTVAEDVIIDGNVGLDVTVLLDPPNNTTLGIGTLTIDAGDQFNLRLDNGTLNVAGLSNSGVLSHVVGASDNSRTGYLNVAGTNQIFNPTFPGWLPARDRRGPI